MEKTEQTGDANTWFGLWSREGVANAEKVRPYFRPRPNEHYTSSKVFVQGDDAALLGQIAEEQFLGMRLVKEAGLWKIKDQIWSDKPYHADSVYAMIPPPAEAFERAGAPWQNVAPAFNGAGAAKRGWQVRTTYDESYLYVRIESSRLFPCARQHCGEAAGRMASDEGRRLRHRRVRAIRQRGHRRSSNVR
jgi:hypothetical protein